MLYDPIPAQTYIEFYRVLVDRFIDREYQGQEAPKNKDVREVWDAHEGIDARGRILYKSERLFGGPGATNHEYFWTLKNRIIANKSPDIRVNAGAFIKALKYLGYQLPPNMDNNFLSQEKQRVKHLLDQFIADHPIDLSINDDTKAATEDNKTEISSLYHLLDGATYVSPTPQGSRNDRTYITLRILGDHKVCGKMVVNYQGEDDSYTHPNHPELLSVLEIHGYFLYEDVLLLTYFSPDRIGNKHAGVMKFEYKPGQKFVGKYLVYYFKDIPPKRRNTIDGVDDLGYLEFHRVESEEEALKYILFQDEEAKKDRHKRKYRTYKLY